MYTSNEIKVSLYLPRNGRVTGEIRNFFLLRDTELWRSEYRYAGALFCQVRFSRDNGQKWIHGGKNVFRHEYFGELLAI